MFSNKQHYLSSTHARVTVYSKNSREKKIFVMGSVCNQLQGRAIEELDGARANVDDWVMLVRHHCCDWVMSWRAF